VGLTYAWAKGWISGEAPPAWREEEIRAMVFVTLVLGYAALIVVNRAAPGQFWASLRVPNPSAWGVILLAWACVVLGMYWPWLAEALKFAPLQAPQWAVALSAGGLSLVALVDLQWVWSQYPARRSCMKKRPELLTAQGAMTGATSVGFGHVFGLSVNGAAELER
jgi:magnesium-transporting ATPase (P-type)